MFLCTCRMQLWQLCQKFLAKSQKTFARTPEMMKKNELSKKTYFSPKYSSEHAQWNFGKPVVTLLPKIRETFPNCKNVEVKIFWPEFFFIKNDSLTTDNAILTTLPKIFLQKATDLPLTFQKMTRKFMNFSKENCFSSNCASVRVECSCDHPVKTFWSKLWKLFAGTPELTKKWQTLQKTYL